ncbi:nucleotidyl transferase AbiEii/AbiGii toxin family protein [Candidatus Daviesbacteria bacterium]|nr:nucleotidyl transferase AbiEii/AbiGii toxin family protein [Candidatus Daviesbacteria bacterium]
MKKPLTKLQEEVLKNFFAQPIGKSYFLTGGTALSGFYFYHRESIDLDLFTFETIEIEPVRQIFQAIATKARLLLDHRVATDGYHKFFLTGKNEGLKIDLVQDQKVHFGHIKTFGNIRVDSIENIGSNKITAIFGRTEAKDFIDLYFILKKKLFTFQKLFQDAKKKDLGLSEFYLAHMLLEVKNLKYFPKILVSFNKEDLENYFVSMANKLLLETKPKE